MTGLEYLLSALLILSAIFLAKKEPPSFLTRRLLIFLSLFAGARYIYWRGFHSLNFEDFTSSMISLVVYLAELYGFLALIFFYFQVYKPSNREKASPLKGNPPAVDIFITTIDESVDLLYKTAVASLAIDYPADYKKVYILDDGHRPEVRKLAKDLGCEYLSRPRNEHAKAGNLNYGLKYSSGQYVLVLDSDHIPAHTFLKETLGFFQDVKVAFVQTPHYFYNSDTFQRNLRLEREIVNEQDLFFYVIQPGKDSTNSSFFAGSGGLFRRSALEEIGGFQFKTLTEDLHTSMVLHARGYKSVYLKKTLAVGLAPESYRSYLKQRQRWTRGGIQVFLLDNPIWKKGLSFMQRVNYFSSIYYFFHGWARLVYLAAPLSFLLLNKSPLISPLPVLLNYYLPYYIVSLIVFNSLSKGYRNPFWSDVYETVMCFFINWTMFATFLRPEKTTFQVTPKGIRFDKPQLEWSYVFPHILLAMLLIASFGFAGYRFSHEGINRDGALVSGFWGCYNLLLLITAIVLSRERTQIRSFIRIPREIKCDLVFQDQVIQGQTYDLSEAGLSMTLNSDTPAFLPQQVKIRLVHASPRLNQPAYSLTLPPDATVQLSGETGEMTEVRGEVTRYDLLPSGKFSIGVKFLNIREDQRQSLIRQIYCSSDFWENSHWKSYTAWRSFRVLATSSFRAFVKEKVLRRLSPRVSKQFKCELIAGGEVFEGVTEDLSYKGLSVRIKADKILPKEVTIQIYHKSLILKTEGEIVRFSKIKGKEMIYGIRFAEQQVPELSIFLSGKLK